MVLSLWKILGFAAGLYIFVALRVLIATGGKPRLRLGYWLAGFLIDPSKGWITKAYLVFANWIILILLIELTLYFFRKI